VDFYVAWVPLAPLPQAAATATPDELKAIRLKIKNIFAKNVKVTGQEKPTANGRFQFSFDTQGRLLNKATVDSSGDANLDQAVLNSATNIPPTIIALFKPTDGTKSVKIEFGVADGWWKAGIQNSQTTQSSQQNQSPATVLQTFANNILKQRPNSTISKFQYQIYTDGVSLITAKGNFGNEEIFAFMSPSGKFNPKGLAPKMSKLTELEKSNHLIFGGTGYTQILVMHSDGEIKAEKDFYFDNDKQVVTDAPSIKKSQEGKGVQRFDNYVIFSGYSIDEIKDQLIEKVMSKDKDTQVDDSGRVLTLKMHNPEGKHFNMAVYKALMGPRYSNMDVIIKFIFSSKGELVKVIPQAVINITNAFGRTESTPMNAREALDSLERLF